MATEREKQPKRDGADSEEAGRRDLPKAGPHAAPKLTDPEKTPGSGTLPSDEGDAGGATEAPTG